MMRPRTPSFLWIPFVFSIGGLSWALLVAALAIFAAVILTPAVQDLRIAEKQRNDLQTTVNLLNDKIALQKEFLAAASTDPLLMQRLAVRQLHFKRPDQQPLPLYPAALQGDRSVQSLINEALSPVAPQAVTTLPPALTTLTRPSMRAFLIVVACLALALSYVLGIRYEPRPRLAPLS